MAAIVQSMSNMQTTNMMAAAMNITLCAQCGTKPVESGYYYYRREFCGEACRAEFKRPAVGKAATYNIGSDYYAYTIVAVSKTGAKLSITQDRVAGPGLYIADTNAVNIEHAHRTQDGSYRVGRSGRLYIGVRETKLDPGF